MNSCDYKIKLLYLFKINNSKIKIYTLKLIIEKNRRVTAVENILLLKKNITYKLSVLFIKILKITTIDELQTHFWYRTRIVSLNHNKREEFYFFVSSFYVILLHIK